MATTIVPPPRNPKPGVTFEDVAKIHESLVSAQGDCDKATDPDDEAFYAGQVSAYTGVLDLLTEEA